MSFLDRIFGKPRDERAALRPLYDRIVQEARRPAWYVDGGVPDTVDGRFDMLSGLLALVLLRLEGEGELAKRESVLLTELFIDDMDGSLREMGIGDVIVGKRIGKIMGALGGRMGSFRSALAGQEDFADALRRNIFRDAPVPDGALRFLEQGFRAFQAQLVRSATADLIEGRIAG